jgi:peptidoglycan/xylan/chitin deacetylase (PgdA/CDA1 family)
MIRYRPLFAIVLFCLLTLTTNAQSDDDAFDGTLRRIYVPILMYHYVSPLPPEADIYRVDLTVEPDIFRAHMQYLWEQGYETISLYDLHAALNTGAALPPRPIILTFDDGYQGHFDYAFPILQEFNYTGTFFVITGRTDASDPSHLNWQQTRTMAEAGMSMEGHTKHHQDLRGRDYAYLVYEIIGSIESIAAHTGQSAAMFAYPAGRYDDDVLRVMNSSQILRAVTTQYGAYHTTDNAMEVSRIRIHGNVGVPGLAQLLDASR